MKIRKKLWVGIAMILTSAVLSSAGQLFWKLATEKSNLPMLLCGAGLYGLGAFFMMISFRFGELSILHPMMSFGYVLSIFLGVIVLRETVSLTKIAGIAVIMLGMFLLGSAGGREVA